MKSSVQNILLLNRATEAISREISFVRHNTIPLRFNNLSCLYLESLDLALKGDFNRVGFAAVERGVSMHKDILSLTFNSKRDFALEFEDMLPDKSGRRAFVNDLVMAARDIHEQLGTGSLARLTIRIDYGALEERFAVPSRVKTITAQLQGGHLPGWTTGAAPVRKATVLACNTQMETLGPHRPSLNMVLQYSIGN